jgi:flagellar biosynthetic protein FlhB
MAEENDQDKTEAPSQKRIDDAFEQGDVPRSPEITSWATIAAMAIIVGLLSGPGVPGLTSLKVFLAHAGDSGGDVSVGALYQTIIAQIFFGGLWTVFAVVILSAVAGSALQHRLVLSLEPVTPKLSNISPLAGLKRVFGLEALVQFAKTLLKMGAVGAIIGFLMIGEIERLPQMLTLDLNVFFDIVRHSVGTLIFSVLAVQTLIAGGDYLYRFMTWYERLKMTRQDVKEEYKEQEGSPEIRQKLRQMRRDFAKRGMMKKVPKATVIVTNPTHFAVALQYENGMAAPLCLAKGVDIVALRIRALAEEHRVPIVEDPPLARSLYRLVEIDEQIPLDLYKPVAEIIGYVMRLKRGQATRYTPSRGSQ